MKSWQTGILIVTVIFSCGRQKTDKDIPRKDLIPLLVDMHIADALAMNHAISDQFKGLDSTMIYSSVLNKHGYTKDELTNTLEYYSSRPEKLTEIYDEVFSELSKRSEEAKTQYNKYSFSTKNAVWKSDRSSYRILGKKAAYPEPFELPLDSPGIYALHASMKMDEEDSSLNPRIIAYFYDSINDVPENRSYFDTIQIPKSKFTRVYTLINEYDGSAFTNMRIIIPEYDNKDTSFYKNTHIYNLRVSRHKPNEN
ncbi:MAG: DUF4296 domain-containing protein [Bacteroidales bacterium]|jgi:hypothetical protein